MSLSHAQVMRYSTAFHNFGHFHNLLRKLLLYIVSYLFLLRILVHFIPVYHPLFYNFDLSLIAHCAPFSNLSPCLLVILYHMIQVESNLTTCNLQRLYLLLPTFNVFCQEFVCPWNCQNHTSCRGIPDIFTLISEPCSLFFGQAFPYRTSSLVVIVRANHCAYELT